MAVNKEGHIFVVECGGHCVSVFTEEGTFLYRFGHKGKAEGEFYCPNYILITPDDLMYITDGENRKCFSRMVSLLGSLVWHCEGSRRYSSHK